MKTNDCPLTPALLELLQAACDAGTTDAQELAALLHRSPNTIRTEFQQINLLLNVHSRVAALLLALRHGWIVLPPPRDASPNAPGKRMRLSIYMLRKNTANAVFLMAAGMLRYRYRSTLRDGLLSTAKERICRHSEQLRAITSIRNFRFLCFAT